MLRSSSIVAMSDIPSKSNACACCVITPCCTSLQSATLTHDKDTVREVSIERDSTQHSVDLSSLNTPLVEHFSSLPFFRILCYKQLMLPSLL